MVWASGWSWYLSLCLNWDYNTTGKDSEQLLVNSNRICEPTTHGKSKLGHGRDSFPLLAALLLEVEGRLPWGS